MILLLSALTYLYFIVSKEKDACYPFVDGIIKWFLKLEMNSVMTRPSDDRCVYYSVSWTVPCAECAYG